MHWFNAATDKLEGINEASGEQVWKSRMIQARASVFLLNAVFRIVNAQRCLMAESSIYVAIGPPLSHFLQATHRTYQIIDLQTP